ncbi:MAG: 2-hydroxyacyl-CoA dehydratase [Thermoplasmata archaeon]|nr:MAG: 2-hydroxyacyl-CoA dehydratase [Thermoplasmata archaeon]
MTKVGITALIPPELIFACGKKPCDINNFVPLSNLQPSNKLCAWTAIWRDMILKNELALEYLVVVAGGDCHNALVDGQKVEMKGLPTFFLFYPFDDDSDYLKDQLEELTVFLGGIKEHKAFKEVKEIKKKILEIDDKRIAGKISAEKAFEIMVSASDLRGDISEFERLLENVKEEDIDFLSRIALLGVPPIYPDFHENLASLGLHVVYDELPYEFVRLSGVNIDELAKSYCNYTFARNLDFRLKFLEKELKRRRVDGIIHYTQFACHHLLEDDIFRKNLNYPFLTIQGDMPKKTTKQVKLRLEAFSEMLGSL